MLNKGNIPGFVFAFLAEGDNGGLPWWAWLLIIIVVILLIWFLWRWFTRSQATSMTPPPAPPAVKAAEPVVAAPPAVRAAEPVIAAPPTPVKPDDLTLIEGIGPKIASVLQAAGITTFHQLAGADLARVQKILDDQGLRLADPSTWTEQARLAAEGKWEEFKALTDSLKGGRRVE